MTQPIDPAYVNPYASKPDDQIVRDVDAEIDALKQDIEEFTNGDLASAERALAVARERLATMNKSLSNLISERRIRVHAERR